MIYSVLPYFNIVQGELTHNNRLCSMIILDYTRLIQDYINNVCKNILECTAVFKNTEEGQEHLRRFVKAL